ncbi:hypothetical protein DY245_42585 [Streptomyces inhibens]|uniref:Uncharacterized protein n=1 Tax=Streptomyces inhibens TaxID=2293571 RepID=A0A371PPY7_STRIH|nr:hypothetical protein [Streptomyces inhibens]REK84578.1 hypothetical protein DY245_42585 [Streptomyces inhibens]
MEPNDRYVYRLAEPMALPAEWDTPQFKTAYTRRLAERIARQRTLAGWTRARLQDARNWATARAWTVEEAWYRHITHRELYREFDRLSRHFHRSAQKNQMPADDLVLALQHLHQEVERAAGNGQWDPNCTPGASTPHPAA